MRSVAVLGAAIVLGSIPLLLPRRPSAIPLTEQRVHLQAELAEVFQVMSAFDKGPNVLARSAREVIAEFPVRAGWFRVTTLERVTLDPDKQKLTFEQLRSPFFSVRMATEVFELAPVPDGGTQVTLRGVIWPRLGVLGWLITRVVVRPHWDRIDATFLEGVRQACQQAAKPSASRRHSDGSVSHGESAY